MSSPSSVCIGADNGFGNLDLYICEYNSHVVSKVKIVNGVYDSYEVIVGKKSIIF